MRSLASNVYVKIEDGDTEVTTLKFLDLLWQAQNKEEEMRPEDEEPLVLQCARI